MSRNVALRASAVFIGLMLLFAGLGLGSYSPLAEALFLVSVASGGLLLSFAFATPAPKMLPVRARARR